MRLELRYILKKEVHIAVFSIIEFEVAMSLALTDGVQLLLYKGYCEIVAGSLLISIQYRTIVMHALQTVLWMSLEKTKSALP